ncbi:spore germination protein [Desulfofalx alkaliphila]|uniref:spore germination protein n=1 Tax=Desulfofalx alkaliphila TaxID=105483 RepID=UPI000AFE642F|nr:spore germination protein [Desulfofalx alkaliphila]
MRNRHMLEKLLGFKTRLKTPLSTNKPSEVPADPIQHVFSARGLEEMKLSYRLDTNIDALRTIMAGNSDFVIRKFSIGPHGKTHAAVAYLDGMVNTEQLHDNIITPMMTNSETWGSGPDKGIPFVRIKNSLITVCDLREVQDFKLILSGILSGDVLIIVDGHKKGELASIKGFERRGISEPAGETVVRGPREGFTENIRANTVLVRRRVQSPNFILENLTIGRVSNTSVAIGYIRGIVDPEVVKEVKRRLNRIEIDGVLESGNLEEFIVDNPFSPFPQVMYTERPDRASAALLEGRVVIFTNNTPFVLIVPAEFVSFVQSPEDYYENFYIATFIRWMRYFALATALLLPSFYIAIITFHQEMIPTPLLISVSASREGVPFPALVEALMMEFAFEVLREAGIRMPRPVGQAVSIVGALVVGQAAVEAGIVSPLMVIVVALTGIASFVNPVFSLSITMRLLRFPIMILAGTLGLFGVMAAVLVILVHMCGLRSFGVPYLSPLAPYHPQGLKDVLVRVPEWMLDRRPEEISKDNPYRNKPNMKPGAWQNRRKEQTLKKEKSGDSSYRNSAWRQEQERDMEHSDLNISSDVNIMEQTDQGGDDGGDKKNEEPQLTKRRRPRYITRKKK